MSTDSVQFDIGPWLFLGDDDDGFVVKLCILVIDS